MKDLDNASNPDEGEGTAIAELLFEGIAVREFGRRWLQSANRGSALGLLSKERIHSGELRLPVWEYLAGLARQAGVTLDALLAVIDFEPQPVVNPKTARAIAHVLREIGCSLEGALGMLRRSFAEVHGRTLAPPLFLVARTGDARPLDPLEADLDRMEALYPTSLRQELHEVLNAASSAYSE